MESSFTLAAEQSRVSYSENDQQNVQQTASPFSRRPRLTGSPRATLGETTSCAYNLATNTTTVTYPPDASGHVGTASMTYDATGNLLSSTDPNGLTTTNVYDTTGNLANLTDANGHTTANAFDLLSDLTAKTLPDGSLTETRSYDTSGNLTSLTHFSGKTT